MNGTNNEIPNLKDAINKQVMWEMNPVQWKLTVAYNEGAIISHEAY